MPDPEDAPSPPAVPRDRSPGMRRAARANTAERDRRIVDLLNGGVSVAEIARREGLSMSRTRGLIREVLARREPQPPADYLAAQVGRLNEALLVSFDAMADPKSGANFAAIDRVVKIVRELDLLPWLRRFAARGPEPTRAVRRRRRKIRREARAGGTRSRVCGLSVQPRRPSS